MPQQTDPATRTRICKVNESLAGEKVRVAGKVFCYDVVTGLIVLLDKTNGLLVDTSNALDGQSGLWATERLSTIMVIGQLERSSTPLPMPTNIPSFRLNNHVVLRAILVIPATELDLDMWNAVLKDEESEQDGNSGPEVCTESSVY
ncbi:hypothetical protein BYT27DRAFT_7140997, partial [Phlegmacium glaucopus]